MKKHFSALRGLAASRPAPAFADRNTTPTANTYQWYVCQVDQLVASLDIPKLKEDLTKMATKKEREDEYINFLNELLLIWNKWKGDIHPTLDLVYKNAIRADNKIPDKFLRAIKHLETLSIKVDPDTKDALETVTDSMQVMVDGVSENINTLTDQLLLFINSFTRQKEIFSQLCQRIIKDQGVKEDAIKALDRSITQLNSDIATNERGIIGMSIVEGFAVIFGIISIVGAFFSGGLTLLAFIVLGPAIGVAAYFIDKYRKDIERFRGEIKRLDEQKKGLNTEIGLLLGIKTKFEKISEEGSQVKGFVEEIKKPWDALSSDLRKIREELNTPDSDKTSVYAEYCAAFKDAQTLWTKFAVDIQALQLPMRCIVPLADLNIQTQADLDRIMKQSINLDDYFKRGRA